MPHDQHDTVPPADTIGGSTASATTDPAAGADARTTTLPATFREVEQAYINLSRRLYQPLMLPAQWLGAADDAPPLSTLRFRTRLERPDTSYDTRDHAWRHIIAHAQTLRGEWLLVAAGTVLHALAAMVPHKYQATSRRYLDQSIFAELLFVLTEREFDAEPPRVWLRLVSQTKYWVFDKQARQEKADREATKAGRQVIPTGDDEIPIDLAEWGTYNLTGRGFQILGVDLETGDPLIVLADLVRAGRLPRGDAALIARTQWLGYTIGEAAAAERALTGNDLTEAAAAQRIYLTKPVIDLLFTPPYGKLRMPTEPDAVTEPATVTGPETVNLPGTVPVPHQRRATKAALRRAGLLSDD